MKPKNASEQEQDILINAVITVLLVTVVGMVSNVIIMLLGLLIALVSPISEFLLKAEMQMLKDLEMILRLAGG